MVDDVDLSSLSVTFDPNDLKSPDFMPRPEYTDEDREVTWGDYGRGLTSGTLNLGAGVVGLTETLAGNSMGGVREWLNQAADEQMKKTSLAFQRRAGAAFIPDEGEESVFDVGLGGSLAAKGLQTIPSLIASIIPAGIAVRASAGATAAVRAAVGATTAKTTAAAINAGDVANQIYSEIDGMTDEELMKSPVYAGYVSMGMTPDAARQQFMKDVVSYAPLAAAAITYFTGGLEGQVGARLGGGASQGFLGGIRQGAISEGRQEAIESGSGAAMTQGQLTVNELSDMDWLNILSQTVEGGVVGAVIGGIGGGAANIGGNRETRRQQVLQEVDEAGPDAAQSVALAPDAPSAGPAAATAEASPIEPDQAAALGFNIPRGRTLDIADVFDEPNSSYREPVDQEPVSVAMDRFRRQPTRLDTEIPFEAGPSIGDVFPPDREALKQRGFNDYQIARMTQEEADAILAQPEKKAPVKASEPNLFNQPSRAAESIQEIRAANERTQAPQTTNVAAPLDEVSAPVASAPAPAAAPVTAAGNQPSRAAEALAALPPKARKAVEKSVEKSKGKGKKKVETAPQAAPETTIFDAPVQDEQDEQTQLENNLRSALRGKDKMAVMKAESALRSNMTLDEARAIIARIKDEAAKPSKARADVKKLAAEFSAAVRSEDADARATTEAALRGELGSNADEIVAAIEKGAKGETLSAFERQQVAAYLAPKSKPAKAEKAPVEKAAKEETREQEIKRLEAEQKKDKATPFITQNIDPEAGERMQNEVASGAVISDKIGNRTAGGETTDKGRKVKVTEEDKAQAKSIAERAAKRAEVQEQAKAAKAAKPEAEKAAKAQKKEQASADRAEDAVKAEMKKIRDEMKANGLDLPDDRIRKMAVKNVSDRRAKREAAKVEEPEGLLRIMAKRDAGNKNSNRLSVENTPEWTEQATQGERALVWHEGDIALVRAFNVYGRALYVGTKKDVGTTKVDISDYTGSAFTPTELQKMLAARDRALAHDASENAKNPDGPFAGGKQVAGSQNIPVEYVKLLEGWRKLLGIKARIYLSTPQDAYRNEFYGPFRGINSSGSLDGSDNGATRRLPNGDHYIILKLNPQKSTNIEVLAHELGHILQKEEWQGATPGVRAAILADFKKWQGRVYGGTTSELVQSLRGAASSRAVVRNALKIGDPLAKNLDNFSYWTGFEEYFADQVSKWAVTSERPRSLVEQFFARIAEALKRLYASVAGEKTFQSEAFQEWLDKRAEYFAANPATQETIIDYVDVEVANQFTENLSVGEKGRAILDRVTDRGNFTDAASVLRTVRRATDTMAMVARRALRFGEKFGGAARRVDLLTQRMERVRLKLLKDPNGGYELVRAGDELARKYGEKFTEMTDVMFRASELNVNLAKEGDVANNDHLGKDAWSGWQGKKQQAALEAKFRALPAELQDWALNVVKFGRDELNTRSLETIKVVLRGAGIEEPGLAERIHENGVTDEDREKFKSKKIISHLDNIADIKKLEGWYVPFMRDGDYVVRATRTFKEPEGAGVHKVDENDFIFVDPRVGSEARARDMVREYVEEQGMNPRSVRKVWVNKNNPTEILEAENNDAVPAFRLSMENDQFELFESESEARERAKEMEGDKGFKDVKLDLLRQNPNARWGGIMPSQYQTVIQSLVHNDHFQGLAEEQKEAVIQAMREVNVRLLPGTRIQKTGLRRKNVAGYSRDLLSSLGRYAEISANYRARLQYQPDIDAALKEMGEVIDETRDGFAIQRREILRELENRVHDFGTAEENTTLATVSRRLRQVTMLDKLAGVSFHIINSLEPSMTALPYIAGRHGIVNATRFLKDAYNMIGARGAVGAGLRDTVKAYSQDVGMTDYLTRFKNEIMANVQGAEGKRLASVLDYLDEVNLIGDEAGMEMQRITRPSANILGRGLDRADLMARQVGQAMEAINRSVVGLSAYQAEFARTGDHQKSLDYARDTVDITMGNYSQANAPAIFNHPVGAAVLQFKKFAQKMYYLLGKLIGDSIRGDREAQKQFAYIMMTHALMAGALGLPLEPIKLGMMTANMIGLTDSDYNDFEKAARQLSAQLFGTTAGEALTRGMPRLIGIDVSSRLSLADLLTFGEPKGNKPEDLKSWIFDVLAGAPAGTVIQQIQGAQELFKGNYGTAAEKMIPLKAARDINQAITRSLAPQTNKFGKETLSEYSLIEAGVRAVGFRPAREAEVGEMRRTVGADTFEYNTRRQELIRDWVGASEGNRAKQMIAIERFNRELPKEAQISRDDLRKAEKARKTEKKKGTNVQGLRFTNRTEYLKDEMNTYNLR